ncbi:alpha/beta fold hydrolase [Streptomyces sp. DSM 118878]
MEQRKRVSVNGVELSVLDKGSGPIVLLLHGFPETSYSWRHQIDPLVDNGYRVIAPDLRGYGDSSCPASVDAYGIAHYVGDLVGLIRSTGEQSVVVIGHDWGGQCAWDFATMRPDLVRAVMGISAPPGRGEESVVQATKKLFDPQEGTFYLTYFQEPGLADAEFDQDVRTTLRKVLYGLSGDNPADDVVTRFLVRPGERMIDRWEEPEELPRWLTEDDLETYAQAYETHGFTSALNFYRNLERNWEITAPFHGMRLPMPAMLLLGEHDVVLDMPGVRDALKVMPQLHADFREPVIVPGSGHWVQQEKPEFVTNQILGFLNDLKD